MHSQIYQGGEVREKPLGQRGELVVAQIPVTVDEFVSAEGISCERKISLVIHTESQRYLSATAIHLQ